MPYKSSQIENLLNDLRNNYLAELPSRFDELDNLILGFDHTDKPAENYENLYRNVHSIKGSAGTHTLHIISTICHDFEDQLSLHQNNITELDRTEIDCWLRYVDLLRKAHALFLNENADLPSIEHELQSLRTSNNQKITYRCLLVAPTKLQRQICESVLAENNTSLAVAGDGYEALGRLLASNYDFLITNHEISMLNGLALIAATRMGSHSNRDIQSVLLTSNDNLTLNRRIDPDYILIKNSQLTENLVTVVDEILQYIKSSDNND